MHYIDSFDSDYTPLCSRGSLERGFGEMIARELGIPCQLGEILYNRGVTTLKQAKEFLYPQLSMLPMPEKMKGVREAVSCILENCRENRPIFIHGDYDVDGITATALLMAFFREIGQESFFYIPNRLEESYGLSVSSINRLVAQCPGREGVIISVDCGITAIREVAYAKQLGHRIIVTDHHEPQDILPAADAILNPKQAGCTFPCSFLSGVGVTFFLVMALRKTMAPSVNLKKYLDLVALGTVADVVPLLGVNRVLVRAGLEVLSAKDRLGVFSLCNCSGLEVEQGVLSEDISFKLAPRINAAGRLGCPHKGVELLLAEDMQQARQAALALEQMNAVRKQLVVDALAMVEAACVEQAQAGVNGLTIYQYDCHPGVLGILASRIVERYNRPTIVFTDDKKNGPGDLIKGSGRSIREVNLFHVLDQCSYVLEQFGGHAMAVGLTLKKKNLGLFAQLFNQKLIQFNNQLSATVETVIDYKMTDISLLTKNFAQALQWLQPFGEGNPEPIFLLPEQKLLSPRVRNGHLIFQVQGRGHIFHGIGFRLDCPGMDLAHPANLVFQLKRSWFKGAERDQVHALQLVSP
jgi:single-stranded-DNA-specific exonuclease